MASKTAILSVRIISDAKKAVSGLKETKSGIENLESGLGKIAPAAAAASAGVVALGKSFVDAASERQQALGAMESVFLDADRQGWFDLLDASQTAAKEMGISIAEFDNFAALIGSQLKNLGVESDQLGSTSIQLIQMGADLSSMFGGTAADAIQALSAALRGETDPVERYGISIKKSDINARLAAEGLDELEGEALKAAETQTLLAMLTEQSTDAQGNFARETDTAAGAMQIASAQWRDAKEDLGAQLLPIVVAVAQRLGEFTTHLGDHMDAIHLAMGLVLGFTGVIGVLAGAVKTIKILVDTWKFSQIALNAVMAGNPFAICTIAVVALVAALVTAYQKSETFRIVVQVAGIAIKKAWEVVFRAIMKVIEPIVRLIQRFRESGDTADRAMTAVKIAFEVATLPVRTILQVIKDLVGWLSKIVFPKAPKWVQNLYGSGTSELQLSGGAGLYAATGGGVSPAARSRRSPLDLLPESQSSQPVVINVNVTDSVVGNERLLADVVTRAIKHRDVSFGRRSVFS